MSRAQTQHGLAVNLKIALYRNAALITVICVFIAFYVFYNLNHPRGFSTAVYIQNTNEVFCPGHGSHGSDHTCSHGWA